ncbi:MAG: hypothetical protein H6895_03550 [Defluviimonas sp.]|uniref:hypothetical protein n=1 Tax=Albidovulum sp. TaxID=1872424 RepID=UPI001D1B17F8|nr:hypothetical protein [Paracoccaceae bacterium]MCC0063148.1 hypothetical protein [Defluviimonas sp.]
MTVRSRARTKGSQSEGDIRSPSIVRWALLGERHVHRADQPNLPSPPDATDLRNRLRFGHIRNSHEVELETDDARGGLEAPSRAFGRAAFAPLALRLTRSGTIRCRLAHRSADLPVPDDALSGTTGMQLLGWRSEVRPISGRAAIGISSKR